MSVASDEPTETFEPGDNFPTLPFEGGDATGPSSSATTFAGERYERKNELGMGGMGMVVEAHDHQFNRSVAMKTLHASMQDAREQGLFFAEAQINSQLEHPNMVPVHDIGVDEEGRPYFTMRLVRGHQSLGTLIESLYKGDRALNEVYSFKRRVHLIQQVCHALEYAHQRGVVHCDIKPSNIVVGDCGELFVVDWGISQLVGPDNEAHPHGLVETSTERNEDEAKLYGTTRYMAPERIVDPRLDATAASDVYSLCAVLYEFLTLRHYLGEAALSPEPVVAYQVVTGPRKSAESHIHAVNGRVPRTLSKICAKGLSVEPEERFESAAELREALQRWVEGRIPMICPGTTIQRSMTAISELIDRHPVAIPALIVTGLACGLAALGFSVVTLLTH